MIVVVRADRLGLGPRYRNKGVQGRRCDDPVPSDILHLYPPPQLALLPPAPLIMVRG